MLSNQNATRPRPGGKAYVSPEGIIYCTDGKYRWVYEFDQRKKPTILYGLLWKFMTAGAVAGLLAMVLALGTGGTARFQRGLLVMPTLIPVCALAAVAVFAAQLVQNGPALCLLFTADEDGVTCQRVRGKTNREKVAHAIAAWVGGQSQPSLRFYDPVVSRYDRISAIHPEPNRDLIRVSGLNIYAQPTQFPLVLDYLKRQCPRAK